MFGSQVLETVIGLVFFFLLLSLGFTALNELISALMAKRSKNLQKGIMQLLQDPSRVEAVYSHPLMKSLSKNGKKPSYVPPKTFVLSLISSIAGSVKSCKEICDKLSSDPENPVNRQLLPLVESAQGDMNQAFKNIEEWFDNSMDRIAGWYKRWTMVITFSSSLIISILINADAIMIAKLLWSNTGLRAGISEAADSYVKNQPALYTSSSDFDMSALKLTAAMQQVQLSSFPLGWTRDSSACISKTARVLQTFPPHLTRSNTFSWWFSKIIGILFTVLAVSLGAPFWFDFLNTTIKIRSSGARAPDVKG